MSFSLRQWAVDAGEMMDDPAANAHDVVASLRDIARINRVFGDAAVVSRRIDQLLPAGASATLLDIGTGAGDIPRAVAARLARRGVTLTLLGLERHPAAAGEARRRGGLAALVADGGTLPFADHSVDVVLCAKLLHHLPGEPGRRLLREMDRVARVAAIVADIRRSPVAAAGIWLASFPMRFHHVTRRDAVISVLRSFSAGELRAFCRGAGINAEVRSHPGWCLTATWRPVSA